MRKPLLARKQYPGKWLAVKNGQVVASDSDRRRLHQKVRQKKIQGVYITYAGPSVKPGYQVILISTNHANQA